MMFDVFRQNGILHPQDHAAAACLQVFVGFLDELYPFQASVYRVIWLVAVTLDSSVVNLVRRDEEVIHTLRGFEYVVIHREDQVVSARIAHRTLIVIAIGTQVRELRMLQYKSHVGGRLDLRHDLYETLPSVIDDFL
jgi:hypothetical protein